MALSLAAMVAPEAGRAQSSPVASIRLENSGGVLASLEEGRSLDQVGDSIRSLQGEQRVALAMSLGDEPDPHGYVPEVLLRMLADPLPQVRSLAAASLARLGDRAFPVLFRALDSIDPLIDRHYARGHNGDQSTYRSDYLSWVLVNGNADPTQPLVDWVRRSPETESSTGGNAINRVRFASLVIAVRGQRSPALAISLLNNPDRRLRDLGAQIAARMGPEALEAREELARYAVEAAPGLDLLFVVTTLMSFGPPAQPLLVSVYRHHASDQVRDLLSDRMGSSPDAAAALVETLRSTRDPHMIDRVLEGLARQESVPESAVGPLMALLTEERAAARQTGAEPLSGSPAAGTSPDHSYVVLSILVRIDPAAPELLGILPWLRTELPRLARPAQGPIDALARARLLEVMGHIGSPAQSDHPRLLELAERLLNARDFDAAIPAVVAAARTRGSSPLPLGLITRIWREAPEEMKGEMGLRLSRAGVAPEFLQPWLREELRRLLRSNEEFGYIPLRHFPKVMIALALNEPSGAALLLRESRIAGQRYPFCKALGLLLVERRATPDRINAAERQTLGRIQSASCAAYRRTPVRVANPWLVGAEAMEARSDMPIPAGDTEYWSRSSNQAHCETSRLVRESPAFVSELVVKSWSDLSLVIFICPDALSQTRVGELLIDRLNRELAGSNARSASSFHYDSRLLDALSLSLNGSGRRSERAAPFVALARSPFPEVRQAAVSALGRIAESTPGVRAAIISALDDTDPNVARAAAGALVNIGVEGDLWDRAAMLAVAYGTEHEILAFLDGAVDEIRPPAFINIAAHITRLPPFPWPPPRPATMATFGREVGRALLGRPADTLGAVHERLIRALGRIDPNFESSLFGVPGGFVLLTRIEQINEDGSPLPGRDRWRDVRPPPRSPSDYLVRLFFAPPGHYRTIAFVFTDRSNFGFGTGAVPDLSRGGTVLPPNIASIPFGTRQAYALVYAFAKRDRGVPHPFTLLSAREHLQQSGVQRRLESR